MKILARILASARTFKTTLIEAGASTVFRIFIAYLPLWIVILFSYSRGQTFLDRKLLWSSVLYASFALSLTAEARVRDMWRYSRKDPATSLRSSLLTTVIPQTTLWLVILGFSALWVFDETTRPLPPQLIVLIFSATLLSLVHYLLVDMISRKRPPEVVDHHRDDGRSFVSSSSSFGSMVAESGLAAYYSALKWSAGPLGLSTIITVVTYYAASYKGTIVNHATIFGVYLAVALVFKQKIADFLQTDG